MENWLPELSIKQTLFKIKQHGSLISLGTAHTYTYIHESQRKRIKKWQQKTRNRE